MEEREDLENQNIQGGSLPTQGQNSVGAPLNSTPIRVDGIVSPGQNAGDQAQVSQPVAQSPYDQPTDVSMPNVGQVSEESVQSEVVPSEEVSVYTAEVSPNSLDEEVIKDENEQPTEIENQDETIEESQQESSEDDFDETIEPFTCEVTDNKIPHRGVLWYIFFAVSFMVSSAIIVFLTDWVALFFVVVVAGVLLWRSHQGVRLTIDIENDGIAINGRKFLFDDVNSFYFSKIGEDITLNINLRKKYLPKLTYILLNNDDSKEIRERLEKKVPEMEQREESYVDLIIRKLKL